MTFSPFWTALLNRSPLTLSPVKRRLRRLAQESWNGDALAKAADAAREMMEQKPAAPGREFPRRRYRTRVARLGGVSALGYRW